MTDRGTEMTGTTRHPARTWRRPRPQDDWNRARGGDYCRAQKRLLAHMQADADRRAHEQLGNRRGRGEVAPSRRMFLADERAIPAE